MPPSSTDLRTNPRLCRRPWAGGWPARRNPRTRAPKEHKGLGNYEAFGIELKGVDEAWNGMPFQVTGLGWLKAIRDGSLDIPSGGWIQPVDHKVFEKVFGDGVVTATAKIDGEKGARIAVEWNWKWSLGTTLIDGINSHGLLVFADTEKHSTYQFDTSVSYGLTVNDTTLWDGEKFLFQETGNLIPPER